MRPLGGKNQRADIINYSAGSDPVNLSTPHGTLAEIKTPGEEAAGQAQLLGYLQDYNVRQVGGMTWLRDQWEPTVRLLSLGVIDFTYRESYVIILQNKNGVIVYDVIGRQEAQQKSAVPLANVDALTAQIHQEANRPATYQYSIDGALVAEILIGSAGALAAIYLGVKAGIAARNADSNRVTLGLFLSILL